MTNFKKEGKALFAQNPHLKAYQRKKLTLFWLKLLAIEAVVIAFAIYLMQFVESAIVLGICLAVIFPLWLLKPKNIFGKAGIGTVKEITKVSRRVAKNSGPVLQRIDMHDRTFMIFHVTTEAGKEIEFEFPEQYEAVFHQGDRIIKLPAVEYPICLTEHDWTLCPFCGNVFPVANDRCIECEAKPITLPKN